MVMLSDSYADTKRYGVPQQKKFPLPDADHVRSAIKFFNYVDPKYEKQLAQAILKRAKEYGINVLQINIGDDNRFKKYLPNYKLQHHGIKGQKWGVRRYQNPDGTLTEEGKERYSKYWEGQKAINKDYIDFYSEQAKEDKRKIDLFKSKKETKEKEEIREYYKSYFDDDELIEETIKFFGSFDNYILEELESDYSREIQIGEIFQESLDYANTMLAKDLSKEKISKKFVKENLMGPLKFRPDGSEWVP